MEFKNNIRLGIWNSTALFCLDHIMARRRREYVVQIAGKTDILIVVEAHGQDGSQMVLVELLIRSHRLFYFPGCSQASGGVLFCIRNTIIDSCGVPRFVCIDTGRVICLRFDALDQRLGIIGVHISPQYAFEKKRDIMRAIKAQVAAARDMLWLIGGDFNFEALGGGVHLTSTNEVLLNRHHRRGLVRHGVTLVMA
jgi:hypothetical protein